MSPLCTPTDPELPQNSQCIWCESTQSLEAAALLGQAGWTFIHMRAHVHFSRWLFTQPRGNIKPWTTLVCSWREAKPCAAAIHAAATGITEHLRSDNLRPRLSGIIGLAEGKATKVAVSKMIVIVDNSEQETRAAAWIMKEQSVPTFLACSIDEVFCILNNTLNVDPKVHQAVPVPGRCTISTKPLPISGAPSRTSRSLVEEIMYFGLPHEEYMAAPAMNQVGYGFPVRGTEL
mmetsp:Transcript_9806/g.29010  ORF Transcript_9806/g.29010 Transcript_9806/m.29010 type:complete len:233 (-) Transcript_9806:96-794(-)